ncbi:hypothetical protein [Streptosporangium vulgare]|uniref:hypothetical protein n=1 Tax=Streptosporangium vulgare TaxID=46190 RepID=UPI0031CF1197
MLLAVVGYALARGAAAGAVMGFAAGLVSDLLQPAAHLLGQQRGSCSASWVSWRDAR